MMYRKCYFCNNRAEVILGKGSADIKIRCKVCGTYLITEKLSDRIFDYYSIFSSVGEFLKNGKRERGDLKISTDSITQFAARGQKLLFSRKHADTIDSDKKAV